MFQKFLALAGEKDSQEVMADVNVAEVSQEIPIPGPCPNGKYSSESHEFSLGFK